METFFDGLSVVSGEVLIFLGLGVFIFIAGKSQSRQWWIWYLVGGVVGIPLMLLGYWFAESVLGLERFEKVTAVVGVLIAGMFLWPLKKVKKEPQERRTL